MIWPNKVGKSFHAVYSWDTQAVELRGMVRAGLHYSQMAIMQPVAVAPRREDAFIEPFLRLQDDEAQQLMDALWDAGLRPAGAKGSAGQLDAVQRHLEDMRTLVLGKAGDK